MKTCSNCKETKPLDEFTRRAKAKDGRDYRCRECHRVEMAEWRKANPEKQKAVGRRFYKRHGQKVRAEVSAYQKANRERINKRLRERRASDPEVRNNYRRRQAIWRSNNREKVRHYRQNYEAKMKAGGGNVSVAEWQDRLAEFGGMCAYCMSQDRIERDHVVPISRGGEHSIDNLVPACMACNRRKRDRSMLKFLLSRMAG